MYALVLRLIQQEKLNITYKNNNAEQDSTISLNKQDMAPIQSYKTVNNNDLTYIYMLRNWQMRSTRTIMHKYMHSLIKNENKPSLSNSNVDACV